MRKSSDKILITGLALALFLSFSIHKNTSARTLNDTTTQQFEEMELLCTVAGGDSQLVINSEEEYKAIWKRKSTHPDCEDYRPPAIDFKTKTLLVYTSSSGGCRRPNVVQREILKVEAEKKYIVVLRLYRNGLCEKKWSIPFVAVVPKIEAGYKVEFANQ